MPVKTSFDTIVNKTVDILLEGKIILYPTDTLWGLGCDATKATSVEKIFTIKQRALSKALILLVADIEQLKQYVNITDNQIAFLNQQQKPTTIIYPAKKKILANNIYAEDDSIAFRIVKHHFCQAVLQKIKIPIVSTSANISLQPSPHTFDQIDNTIKNSVDYIVPQIFEQSILHSASQIVRFLDNDEPQWIRK